MITYGPTLRRKSLLKAEPILPKPTQRAPSSNGRTVYKDLRLPAEQLADFKKRQPLTMATLSTDKSSSNLHSEQPYSMKQSRYDIDHHNTDSIAQLFQHKNYSQINTKRSAASIVNSEMPAISSSEQKASFDEEAVELREDDRMVIEKEEEDAEGREGENYDDYVLGDRVEEEEPEEKGDRTIKKFSVDHSLKNSNRYACESQSELRLQRQHLVNQRRMLAQIQEDKDIAAIMLQYKNNKQQLLAQSSRKHETTRILASLSQKSLNPSKIEKSTSLPALKPKREVIIPEECEEEKHPEPWKNNKNLLAKSIERGSEMEKNHKLKYTLSYAKLGFGRKKMRTVCEQQILEEEMTSLEEIKQKLRSKGIKFDANKLKQGLVNQKHEPYDCGQLQCPEKRLLSNPLYKKFPL